LKYVIFKREVEEYGPEEVDALAELEALAESPSDEGLGSE
jgi:hypothetical protein